MSDLNPLRVIKARILSQLMADVVEGIAIEFAQGNDLNDDFVVPLKDTVNDELTKVDAALGGKVDAFLDATIALIRDALLVSA